MVFRFVIQVDGDEDGVRHRRVRGVLRVERQVAVKSHLGICLLRRDGIVGKGAERNPRRNHKRMGVLVAPFHDNTPRAEGHLLLLQRQPFVRRVVNGHFLKAEEPVSIVFDGSADLVDADTTAVQDFIVLGDVKLAVDIDGHAIAHSVVVVRRSLLQDLAAVQRAAGVDLEQSQLEIRAVPEWQDQRRTRHGRPCSNIAFLVRCVRHGPVFREGDVAVEFGRRSGRRVRAVPRRGRRAAGEVDGLVREGDCVFPCELHLAVDHWHDRRAARDGRERERVDGRLVGIGERKRAGSFYHHRGHLHVRVERHGRRSLGREANRVQHARHVVHGLVVDAPVAGRGEVAVNCARPRVRADRAGVVLKRAAIDGERADRAVRSDHETGRVRVAGGEDRGGAQQVQVHRAVPRDGAADLRPRAAHERRAVRERDRIGDRHAVRKLQRRTRRHRNRPRARRVVVLETNSAAVDGRAVRVGAVAGKDEPAGVDLDDLADTGILRVAVGLRQIGQIGCNRDRARRCSVGGIQRVERRIAVEAHARSGTLGANHIVRKRAHRHTVREAERLRIETGCNANAARADVDTTLLKPRVPTCLTRSQGLNALEV